jgi:glycine oxidase
MMSKSLHSIAIAGGGLLGRLLAWRLLHEGFDITLYEAGALTPSPAAAFTAAGMISPLSEAVVSDATIYRMGIFALDQWPRWLADFSGHEIASSLFQRRGSLVIAHPQDANELQQFYKNYVMFYRQRMVIEPSPKMRFNS